LAAVIAAPARADKVDDLARTLASDPSYKVRVQAALVLGKLGNKRAVPHLIKALKDSHATVRTVSCGASAKEGEVRSTRWRTCAGKGSSSR
jgi:HEAT repeat protein